MLLPGVIVTDWIMSPSQDVRTLILDIISLYVMLCGKRDFVDGLRLQILR